MLLLAAAGLVAFVLLLYMVSPLISPKPLALPGAHVVVSGLLLLRLGPPACLAGPRPRSPPGPPGHGSMKTAPNGEGHLLRPRWHCPFGPGARPWGPAFLGV
jgi:hypothetical protein